MEAPAVSEARLQAVLDIWHEKGEKTICTITGDCMSPVILDGDTLIIEHGNQNIGRGDVVVIGTPGSFFVNRVVQIKNRDKQNVLVLKADRHAEFKKLVSKKDILGKVVAVRGAKGSLDFNSALWKCLNSILAKRSYASGTYRLVDTPFWQGLHFLATLRSRLFLNRLLNDLILWKAVCSACRLWDQTKTRVLKKKGCS